MGWHRTPSLVSVFFGDVGFENVAFLEVVEFFQTDTALIAGRDFLDVVLETAQGLDGVFGNDDAVTDDTEFGVSRDLAVQDIGAGDGRWSRT